MNKLITRHKLYFFATIIALIALMTFQGAALAEPGKAKAIDACMTRKMAYTIKASGATPRSDSQQIWIKLRTNSGGTVRVEIDGTECIEYEVGKTPNWTFVALNRPTDNLVAGKHNISVSMSRSDLHWSTLWLFPASAQCRPNLDTVNYNCAGKDAGGLRMYASTAIKTFLPQGNQQIPTTSTTTTASTTTSTTKPTTTTTKATIPASKCNFTDSVGVVSHKINLSSSGTQRIWALVSNKTEATLKFSIDNGECISSAWHAMGDQFMWMAVDVLTSNLSVGEHTVRIGSSAAGVKLKKLLIFKSSIMCQPSGDGNNCPPDTTPQTSKPVDAPSSSTTKATTTTAMDHSGMDMGGSSSDNAALEQFRNVDARYSQFENVASSQLPLEKLTRKVNPSSSVFHPEINGRFRTSCDFSHLAYDDPIMKPGQPGKSHLHMFFGNTKTNGNSTPNSIANSGGSTCSGFEANRTAYWFPTIHDSSGKARIPNGMVVYYKSEGVAMPPGGYTEMPQGLKIIAGNAGATSPQVNSYNNGWACGNMFENPNSSLIPNCGRSTGLMLKVHFPRCWDGSFDFDPSKPQEHVMYEINNKCPSTHSKVF